MVLCCAKDIYNYCWTHPQLLALFVKIWPIWKSLWIVNLQTYCSKIFSAAVAVINMQYVVANVINRFEFLGFLWIYLSETHWRLRAHWGMSIGKKLLLILLLLCYCYNYFRLHYRRFQFAVSCQRPFLPGTSLLNQRWLPPLRFQVSYCSTFLYHVWCS